MPHSSAGSRSAFSAGRTVSWKARSASPAPSFETPSGKSRLATTVPASSSVQARRCVVPQSQARSAASPTQCDSRVTSALDLPTRKSRSQPVSACSTVSM